MASKRHKIFNTVLILIPWLSIFFIGKRSIKRYFLASVFIGVFEVINHLYGHKKKWWKFFDKPQLFIRDELPFDLGPYIPMSMWFLKFSFGNLKRFALINATADGVFAFGVMPILKAFKIVRLNRLNYFQFFLFIHYKAYILYGVQYLYEKFKNQKSVY